MSRTRSVAVIGAGYWGPNLVRNFRSSPDWDLVAVCDLDEARARKVVGSRSTIEVETSVERLLSRDDIDAVAIATPARTHAPLALAAFDAGKHVLVEKPLADDAAQAAEMVEAAERANRVLMIDHTYCYTPPCSYIREAVVAGTLGEILYVDSVRINLGLVQPDVDVFWDLAPHDLSILDFILPGGLDPVAVSASGSDPLGAGKACVGYLSMPLAAGGIAHVTRELVVPHQDPADGDRRQQANSGLGRPESPAASLHPRSRRRPRDPGSRMRRSSGRPRPCPTGWATSWFPRCPNGRRCRP